MPNPALEPTRNHVRGVCIESVAARLSPIVIWQDESVDDLMDEFFRAIDEVGFKFWVCPHGCRDFVDWVGDRATCRKCGADNHSIQATPASEEVPLTESAQAGAPDAGCYAAGGIMICDHPCEEYLEEPESALCRCVRETLAPNERKEVKMMRAKMKVTSVSPTYGETFQDLAFSAVRKAEGYPADGTDENNTYAKWTPSAELRMTISNPALIGKFELGQEFYVDFTPCA